MWFKHNLSKPYQQPPLAILTKVLPSESNKANLCELRSLKISDSNRTLYWSKIGISLVISLKFFVYALVENFFKIYKKISKFFMLQ